MLEYNLIDIWRLRNPDKRQFTWRKRNPIIERRIDFWLISDDLQDDVKKAEIIPAIKTDHSAISLSVNSLEDQHLDHPIGSLIPAFWIRPVARIFYGWVRSVDYTDQRAPEALFTRGVRGHAPPGNFEN